ncbi:MAG: fumarylacetoacetate hydrolase family protein, partial [Rhodothalassiaceae bacterium]
WVAAALYPFMYVAAFIVFVVVLVNLPFDPVRSRPDDNEREAFAVRPRVEVLLYCRIAHSSASSIVSASPFKNAISRLSSSAFSPLALTPDELGQAWDGGRLHLPLLSFLNGAPFGRPEAGVDMTFDFPRLIAHAAKTRPLAAGSIIGSGTVSNRDADGGPGRPIAEGGLGYSCIAEQRMVETIREGAPKTPFLHFGDRVRIEMRAPDGRSLFGAIDQEVVRHAGP